jgi:AraC-like DNA-binding protein
MMTRQERLVPLPDNILSFSVQQGRWNDIGVDITEAHCAGRVLHPLCYEDQTRLNVLLEEVSNSPCEPRYREHLPCATGYTPRHLYMAPAGVELWGYCADIRYAKDVTLIFDVPRLEDRFGAQLDCLKTPRLRFSDDPLWRLVKLLADAVGSEDPTAQLYGDGLTAAIVARLVMASKEDKSDAGKLAPWQLRRVIEYLEESLPDHVALADLAALSGLSQWHFSRAFKGSTGLAPYQWQLEARIKRSQSLLLDTRATLEQIAEALGFADAVHFGKTFRKIVGTTPAAWRKAKKN